MSETYDGRQDVDGGADIAEPVDGQSASQAPPTDVGKAARSGGVWSVASYGLSKLTGWASGIVLGRLLMPEHFGLIGMVNIVLGLVQMLGNCGIGLALIHKRDNVDRHANTTWWLDMISGVVMFAAANLFAPVAIRVYHQPEMRLLILVASVNFLITPIGGTMALLVERDLRFKVNAKIDMIWGLTTAVLTIIFAVCGAKVWSFVFPAIIANVVQVILRLRVCPFRPSCRVEWGLAKGLLAFGWKMLGASMLDFLNQNVDYMLVGALMGKIQLGFYIFAYNLGIWIVQNISTTISNVAFPTFASIQKEPDRARAMFLKLIGIIALVGFPIVCIQWAVAPLYIGSIYKVKWLPSVTAFRLIALYGIGRAVCSPGGTLISALGRPDINLKLSAAMTPLLVTAIYIGSKHGINGVAAATACAHGVFVWLYVVVPFKILGWNPLEAIKALAPAFVSSLIAAFVTAAAYAYLGGGTHSLWKLVVLALLGGGVYVAANAALFRSHTRETISLVRTTLRESRGIT